MYISTKSKEGRRKIIEAVPSGFYAVDEVLKQSANVHLFFGGVGVSGVGSYHGKFCCGFLRKRKFGTQARDGRIGRSGRRTRLTTGRSCASPGDRARCRPRWMRAEACRPEAKTTAPITFALTFVFDSSVLDAVRKLNLKTIAKLIA